MRISASLCLSFCIWSACLAPLCAQETSLRIAVVEGEGVIYQTGSRSARGVSVEITDTRGARIPGATVSFQLPENGSSGTFGSGARTEIVNTGPDGKASVWGMRWNNTPGDVEVRVTAALGPARATSVVHVTLARVANDKSNAPAQVRSNSSHKWVWITLAVAAAAGGGIAATGGLAKGTAAAPPTNPPPTISNPTLISIGRP